MPTTRVSRTLAASPQDVWAVLADPWHQARWWPRVVRMEAVEEGRFTQVLGTARGRGVRADFRIVETVEPRLMRWEQELAGSPFERLLGAAVTTVSLEPADGGQATTATIELQQRLLGWSRLTPLLFKRAARRQLAEALAGLDAALSPRV
ncbi:MAG TPA: SRPBCC domain-containing protein [Conexibacter sp.]|nr:SRPBCC domain-containing protein [Conexibacter sp.]